MRSAPVCRFFNGTPGSCHNGDYCPFSHQQAAAPTYGYPSYPAYPSYPSHPAHPSSYQQKSSWAGGFDPSKYKYVAPKKPDDVLGKLTRTISNEEAKPPRTPSPKEIQIVVKNDQVEQVKTEDLSSIYSNPSLISSIDRKAFEAPSFTMGFIPVVAPSADLSW